MTYPNTPGWKHRHATGSNTSAEAARAVAPRAPTQRDHVLDALADCPATPEQIVDRLALRGVEIMLMSCRPRCSELARLGLIVDTGARGKGFGGCAAIIWRITTSAERAAFAAALRDERAAA